MFLTRKQRRESAEDRYGSSWSRMPFRLRRGMRPRIGIQIWLTALFVLITAFAAVAAYEIVRPIMEDTLNRASRQSFAQVGEQFQSQLSNNEDNVNLRQIQAFATNRGLQWGIIRSEDGRIVEGNLEDWNAGVVNSAVNRQRPQQDIVPVPEGNDREGQIMATYAAPIQDEVGGQESTAVVFVKFFTEGDVENVDAALEAIEQIALIAFALALFISGVAGYIVATLISRRVSRLGVAAERLAAGNFDERINTRIEDEVGALGETFNSMASSLLRAFEQVEQEKERGQAILDGMTDAVIGVDRHLNPVFVNPRATELLENSEREFQVRLQETLAKTRYSGSITEPEVEAGDKIIEIRTAPLEDGALAILRDVTAERQIQRAKAQFIANASHELKTPLTAISGFLELLEDEVDEHVRQDFMDEIKTQTRRLQDLARTLLDLSRLDANAVVFSEDDVYLEEMLYALKRDFSYTGREIDVRATEVPPVETDETQLYRALTILMDNAIKYSEAGEGIELDLRRENESAIVSVSDRGCGIPEAEIPRIFERFYRAEGSSRADGTGLGLALAHEITDHLGGDISVESHYGEGSTFAISLPLEKSAKSSEALEVS